MPAIDEPQPIRFQFRVFKRPAVDDSGMKGANGIVAQLPTRRFFFVMSLAQAAEKGGL